MIGRMMRPWQRLVRSNLRIVDGAPLPAGWSGKLWALEQGRQQVTTRYTLFLDADIKLTPGIVAALKNKMRHEGIPFSSLTAVPAMSSIWEKLLMPAFRSEERRVGKEC